MYEPVLQQSCEIDIFYLVIVLSALPVNTLLLDALYDTAELFRRYLYAASVQESLILHCKGEQISTLTKSARPID